MVVRSTVNYHEHLMGVYKETIKKRGLSDAKKFISIYRNRYDSYNRSFIDYKLGWKLMDLRTKIKKGTLHIGIVGLGGIGKSYLAKNMSFFLDEYFDVTQDVKVTSYKVMKRIDKLPKKDCRRCIIADEPDNSYHPMSKNGKQLASIIGQWRIMGLYFIICATDLKDIPLYIYNKLRYLIFVPYHGAAWWFEDKPKQLQYNLLDIRKDYVKMGFKAFTKRYYDSSCDIKLFNTHDALPIHKVKEEIYEDNKLFNLDKSIKDYLSENKPKLNAKGRKLKEQTIIIKKLHEKGFNQNMISSLFNLSKGRVSQIVNNTTPP
jgi:hypothetical protein